MFSILHVDDNPKALRFLGSILMRYGYTVLTASGPEKALRLAQTHDFALILLAADIPSCSSPTLATAIRSLNSFTPIVMYSGSGTVSVRDKTAISAYVSGEQPIEHLLRTIRSCIQPRRLAAISA